MKKFKKLKRKKIIKAWGIVGKYSNKYPHNWGLFIPTFKNKILASLFLHQYVSIGMEANVIPVTISYELPKKVNKKIRCH